MSEPVASTGANVTTQPSRRIHFLASPFPRFAASTIVLGVVVLAGLLVRLLALRTTLAQQNSDTSVVYLMARHVADGDIRVFYWGQFYGGTILQLTAGTLFRLVGSSFVVLEIVEIGFWLAACLLVRSIVAKGCGVVAGDIAAALFWLSLPAMITISFNDPGFYGDGLVIGLAAIRLAQGAVRRHAFVRWAGMGLCLGLALWITPLALAFAGPAALWLSLRVRSAGAMLAGLGGVAVGAAPWLWANAHTHFASLHRQPYVVSGTPQGRYLHVFTELLPSLAWYGPTSVQGRVLGAAALPAILLGLAFALYRRNATIVVLCLSGLLVPLIVVVSRSPVVPGAGRYATFLIPAAAGILAWSLSRVRIVALVLVLLVSWWTITTLWNASDGLARVADPSIGTPIATLGMRLEQSGRSAVWSDYWISYLLSAATEERVVAAALGFRREPSYEKAAMRPRQTTVVLFAGGANDRTLARVPGLPTHARTRVGPFAVWVFATRVDVSGYLTAIS